MGSLQAAQVRTRSLSLELTCYMLDCGMRPYWMDDTVDTVSDGLIGGEVQRRHHGAERHLTWFGLSARAGATAGKNRQPSAPCDAGARVRERTRHQHCVYSNDPALREPAENSDSHLLTPDRAGEGHLLSKKV